MVCRRWFAANRVVPTLAEGKVSDMEHQGSMLGKLVRFASLSNTDMAWHNEAPSPVLVCSASQDA
jgi:hypothetical protein